ncbi:MAG: hypothetical protein K8T90_11170 [Planctomycetes bacterium]|nr:hypothetical protein [Planctomycetota bacterium]
MQSARWFHGVSRTASAVCFAVSVAVTVAVTLSACGSQARTTCGEPSGRGGPPLIATRDGDLCESARLRVAEALGRRSDLFAERAEQLREFTWSWQDAKSLEGFVRRAREDAGDDVADAIGLAIEQVRAHSTKPLRADCADAERCLVRGAALGARIAFDDAAQVLRQIRRQRKGDATQPITPQ